MKNIQTIFVAAILMGITGCATVEKTSSAFDCVPAGFEDIGTRAWSLVEIRQGQATKTESGVPVSIITTILSKGDRVVVAIFIGRNLIFLDPAPEDPGVPSLVNTRYMNEENLIRTTPGGACEWRPLLTGETA